MRGKGEIRRPKSEGRKKSETRIRGCCLQDHGSNLPKFGFWISLSYACCSLGKVIFFFFFATRLFAATNLVSADDIPPLRPPRGELAPTYWEQHGAWPFVLGAVGVLLAGAVVWLLLRPRPAAPVPPAVAAHRALDPLANQPENGIVLSRISQVVRRYFSAAFDLPPGELTTAEFSRELEGRRQVGAALSTAVHAFLRECDRRKFAPSPPPAPLGAAGLATRLIDQAEARRAAAEQAANAEKG
jgi:hypothetical protein